MSDFIDGLGVAVSAVGVGITYLFSKRVWEASKVSARAADESAKAALASYELSRIIVQQQENKEKAIKAQYRRKALTDANKVHSALLGQNPVINPKLILEAPKDSGFTLEEIATYFSIEEAEQINRAWDTYKRYLKKHWPNVEDEKWGFNTIEASAASVETADSILEFHRLIEMLR
jgi:hypothetical protein